MEKMNCWRLAPNQNLSGSQDHLEGTAQLHLPTCLLSTKVVSHLLCKVNLTINYLYHLWPVVRDRVRGGRSSQWKRAWNPWLLPKNVSSLCLQCPSQTDHLFEERMCFSTGFSREKYCRIFLFVVGADNPLYQNVQVYCCHSFFGSSKRK